MKTNPRTRVYLAEVTALATVAVSDETAEVMLDAAEVMEVAAASTPAAPAEVEEVTASAAEVAEDVAAILTTNVHQHQSRVK